MSTTTTPATATTPARGALDGLRQIAELFPARGGALDDWQRGFITDQLARLEKWGDDVHLSEKQGAMLQKILAAMQKAEGEGAQGGAS